MKIFFKYLKIQNFLSFGEAEIDLTSKGYLLVSGENNDLKDLAKSNGSGKSSIFEAIVWALTGETMRGNKDVCNHFTSEGAYVELHFTINNQSFKIIRTKDHSKYKTNLILYVDDQDVSGKGIRDTEKILKEYLPDLTTSLINSVIILGQGMPNKFTDNSPSGRKELLETLCKSDFMIEDLKSKVSKRKIELTDELKEVSDSLLVLQTQIQMLQSSLNNAQMELDNLQQITFDQLLPPLEQESEKLKLEIEEDEKQAENYFQKLSKLLEEREKIEIPFNDQLTELETQDSEKRNPISQKILELKTQKKTLETKIEEIKNIIDICPTCHQKIPDVQKPDTKDLEIELNQIEKSLNEQDIQYNQLQKEYDDKKRKILEELKQSKQKHVYEIDTLVSQQTNFNNQLVRKKSRHVEINKEISNLINRKNNFTEKKKKLEENIKEYISEIETYSQESLYKNNRQQELNSRLSILSKFYSVITRDFRGYLLQDIIKYINRKAKEYCKEVFDTEFIEFKLEGNNISILYNDKQYESLSGGEKQKIDIIIQFSLRDLLCDYFGFSTNILVLDEIFDNLDSIGCKKIIDLISNKFYDINSVYVITHHGEELNIPYDHQILVVKNDQGVSSIK